MGFSSQDDLITQMTAGKRNMFVYQKTTGVAQVAAQWTDLSLFPGLPEASTMADTSLTWVDTTDASLGAIQHGGNVSSATKHFLNVGASLVAAAGAPWVLMCVDQVGYVPVNGADVTSTTSRVVTMTALGAGCRYPNGEGLRAYITTCVAPTAGGPNMTIFNYKDTGGNAGACPVTVGLCATPVMGAFPHTGAAATRYGPFLPLAQGDTGITDIVDFTFTGGTAYTGSGKMAICLVKPLFAIPIPASGTFSMSDFVNQLPSLPKIPDGAYLKFLLFNTGATTISSPVTVALDVAYGG